MISASLGIEPRASWAAGLLLVVCACAGPAATGGISPGAAGKGAQVLLGPRTMTIETTAEVAPDGSGRHEHLVRLGGELAGAAAEALAEPDPGKRSERLQALLQALLLTEGLEVTDARREPAGDVVLQVRQVWMRPAFEGNLRLVRVSAGVAAGLVVSLLPVTAEAQQAMRAAQGQPPPFEHWPAARIQQRFALKVPDGFQARDLPAPVALKDEGLLLEQRLTATSAQRIDGELRLEIGPARVPTARVEQLVQRLQPAARGPLNVKLEMTAETLQASGRVMEAFAETRRLVAAHDREGYYRAKHAAFLLQAGLVEPARAEALKAADLSPTLDYVHQILALTLETGRFGRSLAPGYERARAIEARRQQLALTGPKGRGAYELARLLSRDDSSGFVSPGAPLEEIVQLTAEVEAFPVEAAELHARALLRLGRGEEAERVVRERLGDEKHRHYLLAAITRARGAEAAIAELPALSLSGEAAALPLLGATGLLVEMDAYPQAIALSAAGARVTPRLQERAERLSRLRRATERKPDPRPAVEAIKRLQQACASPASFAQAASALLDARVSEPPAAEPAGEGRLHERVCRTVLLSAPWPPTAFLVDEELAAELEVAGEAPVGYRVRHRNPLPGTSVVTRTFFLGAHASRPRFLGTGLAAAAQEAFRLASAGRTREAAVWLGWARELMDPVGLGGRPAPTAEALELFWAGQPVEPAPVRLTAALLTAYSGASGRQTIPELKRALATNQDLPRRRLLAGALLRAQLRSGQAREADRTGDLLEKLDSADGLVTGMRAIAAAAAGNCPKALAMVRVTSGAVARADGHRRHAAIAAACGAYEEAVEASRKAAAAEGAAATDDNNLAWNLCFSGKGGEEALVAARRAVQRTGRRSPAMLQTLALAAAQAGAIAESRAALADALDRTLPGVQPTSDASVWLVVGATAEALGLPEEAARAYRRVTKDGPPELMQQSGWTLAQRRLAVLEKVAR